MVTEIKIELHIANPPCDVHFLYDVALHLLIAFKYIIIFALRLSRIPADRQVMAASTLKSKPFNF
jgi:hypothetical protein